MTDTFGEKELRRGYILVALLILLGSFMRLALLGTLPGGLNQDEASAGYEAFALLTSGIDRCGKSFPALFVSWGSGQNVLMSWLAMPLISLFGLSELTIRLPNAIAGCLTLPVFWLCARRFGGERFGLLALFLLVINPWHIMESRWALESNQLPLLLFSGVWLTAEAEERPWLLLPAAVCFGASLYAYGTAFFFLPLFLIFAVIRLRKHLRPASFLISLLVFAAIALPITACQIINAFGLDEAKLLGITLPRLTENRQAATSVFGAGDFAAALENFCGFLRILWNGTDGLSYNALPKTGVFYVFGLPTAAVGFVASVFLRKDRRKEGMLRLALICSLLCAFFIDCNINRMNMIWLPLIYFSALGCCLIFDWLREWSVLPIAGMIVCASLFVVRYCGAMDSYPGYFPGLGDSIVYARAQTEQTIYITDRVNQPYIFALFYTRMPPEDFAGSVEYQNVQAAFRRVERFDGFEFEHPEDAVLRILHRSETDGVEILFSSGDYVVCTKNVQEREPAAP